jgi:hypothetical protein
MALARRSQLKTATATAAAAAAVLGDQQMLDEQVHMPVMLAMAQTNVQKAMLQQTPRTPPCCQRTTLAQSTL